MSYRTLTREKKDKILERDCFICAYCDGEAEEVDHVIPWSWSYCDDEYNLVASCSSCNAIANDLVFDGFIEKRLYIRRRIKNKYAHTPLHKKLAECAWCHKPIKIVDRNATNLLCGECNQSQIDKIELERVGK